MRSKQTLALAASSLALMIVLAGCSGDDEPGADPSVAPSATADEGDAPGADGGVVSEDGDSVVTTYQTVPPGFPAQVPLLNEDDAYGSVTEYDGVTAYSVIMPAEGELVPAMEEAVALLTDAGFAGDPAVSTGENGPLPVVLSLDDADIVAIVLGSTLDDGSAQVSYTVEVG